MSFSASIRAVTAPAAAGVLLSFTPVSGAFAQSADYTPEGVASIPVNSPWALALIALGMMVVGFFALRRAGVRTDRLLALALPVLAGAGVMATAVGPQVSQALPAIVDLELDRAGGGTVTLEPGENHLENTSGVAQIIVAIRDLPDCDSLRLTAADVVPATVALPQCEARGNASPPESVDRLAPGESCMILTALADERLLLGQDTGQQPADVQGLCRLML